MLGAAIVCWVVSACSPSGGDDEAAAGQSNGDANLTCAAMISAASYLVASGKTEQDAVSVKRGLVSMMTYLNTYAVPKGLKEPEAFAELKSERETLMAKMSPGDIIARARLCMDRSAL